MFVVAGGKYKSRHKRWFILKENVLYYFRQPTVSLYCIVYSQNYHCCSAMICRDDCELRWRLIMCENELSELYLLMR